jgi:hypothetical protein
MTSGRGNSVLKNMLSFVMQQLNDHGQASFLMKSAMDCIPAGPVEMNSSKRGQSLILAAGGRPFMSPLIPTQSFCVMTSPWAWFALKYCVLLVDHTWGMFFLMGSEHQPEIGIA